MTEPSPRCPEKGPRWSFLAQPEKGIYIECDGGVTCPHYGVLGHSEKRQHFHEAAKDRPSVSGGAPPTERCEGMGGSCELSKGHQFACACNIPPENRWDAGQAATPEPPQDAPDYNAAMEWLEKNFPSGPRSMTWAEITACLALYKHEARAASERAPEPTRKLMVSRGGEIHEECPDCRGECSPYKPVPASQPTEESKP